MRQWHVVVGLIGAGVHATLACLPLLASGFVDWSGVRIIPLALGLAFTCFGAAVSLRAVPHLLGGRTAVGHVVGERTYDGGEGTTYAPVIRYLVGDVEHEVTAAVSIDRHYAIGEAVPVSFLAHRHEDAWLKTGTQVYFFPSMFFGLGGAAVGLWLFIR